MTTSWARSRAFSLVMMRLTWVLDVSGLRNRRPAISSLDRPSATSAITSRSRSVRPTRIWSLGGSRSGRRARSVMSLRVALGESSASPRATHPHRLQQVGRLGVLDQQAACRQPSWSTSWRSATSSSTPSSDELIDGIWGEDPPASSVNALHGYVAGLRMALEPHRARRAPGRVLLASGPGYLLQLEAGQLDAEVFGQHLAAARRLSAGGDLAGAARSLDAGLRLWQSAPLSGIAGPWAQIERIRLGEKRLTAIEERADVMLALGRHAEAAAQLAGLVCEHPLRERFRGQLMLALYRCGRRAEALAVFADGRRVLVEELGIEPGAELRRLQERILAADATLDPPAAPSARSAAARRVRWSSRRYRRKAGCAGKIVGLDGRWAQSGQQFRSRHGRRDTAESYPGA